MTGSAVVVNTADTAVRKTNTALSVGVGATQAAAISINNVGTQTQNTSVTFTGTYTVAAPSGMSYIFSINGAAGSLGSFSASAGAWSGTATVPNQTGSTFITVQGTGSNTDDAMSNTFTLAPASGTPVTRDASGFWFDDPAPAANALVFTGSHHWFSLQDAAELGAFDFTAYVNYIKVTQKTNYIRLWNWTNSIWKGTGTPGWTWTISPLPWNRSATPGANDGGNKFDLTSFNTTYFTRLRTRVQAIGTAGLYCSVMLFNGFSDVDVSGQQGWTYNPFNANNNVNAGTSATAGSTEAINTAINNLQKLYIDQVIAAVGDLSNVMYEICNEPQVNNSGAYNWIVSMMNYIKANQSVNTLVGTSSMGNSSSDTNILSVTSDDYFAPGNYVVNLQAAGPDTTGVKVTFADTDHIFGAGGDGFWCWEQFCRGYHPIYMDDLEGLGIAGSWDFGATFGWAGNRTTMRAAMGQIQTAVGLLGNLNGVVPHDALCSTLFCLANPGSKYICFQNGTGAFTLNLTGFGSTTFSVDWINFTTGAVTLGNQVVGGAVQSLSAPFSGPAIAVLLTSTQPNTISINTISNQQQNAVFSVDGSYTGAAPTSMTCSFSIGGGSTSVGSFTASGGAWSGSVTAPSTAGSTTFTVTGQGPNTATATSSSFSITAGVASITINTISTQNSATPFSISGTYTVAAPTGMNCLFSLGGGSTTVSSFVASSGGWSGQVTPPVGTGSTTLQVTGTGANTASATSNTFTIQTASGGLSQVVALTINEHSGSIVQAGAIFSMAQTLPVNAVPAGAKIVPMDTLNGGFGGQQDNEAYWSNGSLKSAEISFLTPIQISGGAQLTGMHIGQQAGSPNRTGVSAAQIAANSNIVATLSGWDCAGNTYNVGFNDVVANFSPAPWGTSYPVGGWEYIHRGPVRTTVRAWRYLKNSSTGRPHAYVKLELWVTLWATSYGVYTLTGPHDIVPIISQPNSYGPISNIADAAIGVQGAGTIGGRFMCQCVISNNGTTVGIYGNLGGPNDPRATTGISFNASTNQISNPPSWATDVANDFGVPVSFSSMPSSIPSTMPCFFTYLFAANGHPTGYFLTASRYFSVSNTRAQSGVYSSGGLFSSYAGGKAFSPGIWTYVNNQYFICIVGGTTAGSAPSGNATDIVDGTVHWACGTLQLGSAPSGVTTYPLWGCFALGKQIGGDIYGAPLWTGSSPRVRLDPGHDFSYLQTSGFVHKYYNASQAASMINVSDTAPTYNMNQCPVTGGDSICFWDWQFAGDDPSEERYLPINMSGVAWLMSAQTTAPVTLATRRYYLQKCMSVAMNAFDLVCHYADERHGRQMVINNGHSKDGVTYANCAPVNPGFVPFYGEGSPPRGPIAPRGYYDLSGYCGTGPSGAIEGRYQDNTHFFTPWQVPWLKTGRHEFIEEAKDLAVVSVQNKTGFGPNISGGFIDRIMTISGTTYYATVYGAIQIRDWASGFNKIGQCAWVIPDADQLAQMFRDVLADNGAAGAAWSAGMSAATPNAARMGAASFNNVQYPQGEIPPWHNFLLYISTAQLADNYGGSWETLRQYFNGFMNMYDSRVTINGGAGCTYEVGLFDLRPFLPNLSDYQPTPAGVFQNTYNAWGLGTFSCVSTSVISQPDVRGGVWYPPPPQSQLITLFGTSIFSLYRAGTRWRQILGDSTATALLADLDARAASFGGVDFHSAKAGTNIGNFLQGNS